MNFLLAATPTRLAVLALAATLSGCSTIDNFFSGDKADYKATAAKSQPLEVPPDLTQLARESRYQPQGGVISASGVQNPGSTNTRNTATGVAPGTVAPNSLGDVRVERAGQQRWLVTSQTPEQLWPRVKAFWAQRGLALPLADEKTGVMETDWAENRTKLPNDFIRNTIGKIFSGLFDTGERDRFRTRIERTATGSEIYITHRGLEENYVGERKESTAWRARANDPQLEAEMLSSLMVALGSPTEPAKVAVAAATPAPSKVPAVGGTPQATPQATSLVIDEPFDRAWRRVGLALDRGGFTVEDRDRTGGLYYVRYIDPKNMDKDEPNWLSKLFGGASDSKALRYRIALKSEAGKTQLTVQTSAGAPDTGDNAKRIIGLLTNDLK